MPQLKIYSLPMAIFRSPTGTRRSCAGGLIMLGRADYRRTKLDLAAGQKKNDALGCATANRRQVANGLVSPKIAGVNW
jgi:hypothetical protein